MTAIPELGPVTDREYLIHIGVIAPMKTREEVLAEFKDAGISISEWARSNSFSRMVVVDLLRGTRKGLRGESHRCAVALGLKHGSVQDVASFKPAPPKHAKTRQAGVRA